MKSLRALAAGMAAGAAGTTALNAVTYLDMVVRGRPASNTPQRTVQTLADRAGVQIPGDETTRKNRLAGLGPLSGMAPGVGAGAVLAMARRLGFRPNPVAGGILTGAAAMAGTDGSMTALGVTQPGRWSATDWVSDAVPHLVYGLVTAAVVRAIDGR